MKKSIIPLLAIAAVACTREAPEANPSLGQIKEITITASYGDPETRTERAADGAVLWCPGDEVSLFFNKGEAGGSRFVSQNTEVAKRTVFKGLIESFTGASDSEADYSYFWGVYPYSESNYCDGNNITTTLPLNQYGVPNTFAKDLNISIARSRGLELAFYNVCSGLRFNLTRDDIKAVKIKGNNEEPLAGTFKVGFNDSGIPIISELITEEKELVLRPKSGDTFEVGKDYYFVILPTNCDNGFTVSFETMDNKEGIWNRDKQYEFKRASFAYTTQIDTKITEWRDISGGGENPNQWNDEENPGGTTENGIYIGIIGFNSELYECPMIRLCPESILELNTFIDNLSNEKSQTLLCWAVEKSMSKMTKRSFPKNLFNASLVSFTDGFDDGSAKMKRIEDGIIYTRDGYYDTLNVQLCNTVIQDIPLDAYSVGLEGKDASTQTSAGSQTFYDYLGRLITPSGKLFRADNMTVVNDAFQDIAESISNTINLMSLRIKTSEPYDQDRIRFTFDKYVTSAEASSLYIEGVFNTAEMSLTDVKYKGMTSLNTTIKAEETVGEQGEPMLLFVFDGISVSDNSVFDDSYYQRWIYMPKSCYWQAFSETYSGSGLGIRRDLQSAAVMLALDCSSSIGSDFTLLKTYVKSFISKLYEASIDKLAVASITLERNKIYLRPNETYTLAADVQPQSAADKTVVWTSSDAGIVSVNNDGCLTAISTGTAIIVAKTRDGGFESQCQVVVVQPAQPERIDMGLPSGLQWASLNVGADLATDFGSYYSWGETDTKSEYSWANYVWCNESGYSLTKYNSDSNNGFVDSRNTLDYWDDVASQILGKEWRTPTAMEIEELKKNCSVAKTEQGGINGFLITSIINGNSFFIPSANVIVGDSNENNCFLWSASLSKNMAQKAYIAACNDNELSISEFDRFAGIPVRPVYGKSTVSVSGLSLSSSSLEMTLGSTYILSASVKPSNATWKEVLWQIEDSNIISFDQDSGLITALSLGETTITASSKYGDFSASCKVTVTLSKTRSNLALAVSKDGVRYYVTQEQYKQVDMNDYEVDGLTITGASSPFILKLHDKGSPLLKNSSLQNTRRIPSTSVSTTYKYTFANAGVAPNSSQARYIVQNYSAINDALTAFGGSALVADSYWTSYFTGARYYYYNISSGLGYTTSSDATYRVRNIINL